MEQEMCEITVIHEDAVKEEERLTSNRRELDENEKIEIDRKLQIIRKNITIKPKCIVTYFVPDLIYLL